MQSLKKDVKKRRIKKESIIQSIMNRAVDNAELVASEINTLKRNVEGVSFWVAIMGADWEKVKPLLSREAERLGVERFQVVDMNGFAHSTNGSSVDIWDRDYFLRARNGETVVTDPIVSRISGEIVMVCATPIRGAEQRILGVLTVTLDPKHLFRIIEDRKVGETGYGFMLNKDRIAIAHPNQKVHMSRLNVVEENKDSLEQEEFADIERRMVSGETGYGYYTYFGVDKIVAYAPIKDTGWSLALTVPKHEVFRELSVIKYRFIVLTLLAISVSSVFLFFIFKFISQIKSLVEMHHGNVRVTSELEKGSEFIIELPTMQYVKVDENVELINGYARKNNDLWDKVNVELLDIHL